MSRPSVHFFLLTPMTGTCRESPYGRWSVLVTTRFSNARSLRNSKRLPNSSMKESDIRTTSAKTTFLAKVPTVQLALAVPRAKSV